MKKRVTIISVERERIVEIRLRGQANEGWCEHCHTRTRMLTPEELSVIAGFGSTRVLRLVEAGRLHSIRTREGLLFVCLNSLQETASLLTDDE